MSEQNKKYKCFKCDGLKVFHVHINVSLSKKEICPVCDGKGYFTLEDFKPEETGDTSGEKNE